MARPLRLEFPGALYHVTSRGNARARIYTDDDDYRGFLELLASVCDRHNWTIHAYCLMSNHYHVVLETPEPTLAKGMRQLNGVYTQDFNRRHRKGGHLFQGRYTAIVVDKDKYLLELARYVVLNPVRAGLVKSPGQWPWSSYRATIGKVPVPAWLSIDFLLAQFSARSNGEARARYVRFVAEGKDQPTIWQNLRHQIYLGDETFVKKLHQRHKPDEHLTEVPRAQRRPPGKPLTHYARLPDAKEGMRRAYASGDYTLSKIAKHFGVHYSTVSRALGRRGGKR